jgi:hypothetical protein
MDIPDELWASIRALAEVRLAQALADIDREVTQMAMEYATKFIDVSTIDTQGKQLMHVPTGRTLTLKAEWTDG